MLGVRGGMGLCSGKLGPGQQGDILATTAWVREVVTSHQKRRRGEVRTHSGTCHHRNLDFRNI